MENAIAIIITSIVGVAVVILSIFMLTGNGKSGFLIAGYNTMSAEKKAKYDQAALSKFMGKILLPIGISCPGLAIAAIYPRPSRKPC